MTCFEAQSLIIKYLNSELDRDQLREFLYHCDNCEVCRDELEVNYTIITAMRQLEEDEEITSDFHEALEEKLQQSWSMLFKNHQRKVRNIVLLIMLVLLIPVILSFESSQVNDDKEIVYTNVKESNFELEYRYNRQDKGNGLDAFLDEHKDEIDIYLNNKKSSQNSVDEKRSNIEQQNSIN